jgi:CPA2 family monovalent cation:H+ antiporter-2
MTFQMPLLLAEAGGANLVRDMLVILGAAAVISVLLRRLHLAAIPGYLIVGTLIGSLPSGLITSHETVEQIQEIAVILLMFTIGLHLELESIRTGMVPILIVGAASTIASSVIMWPIAVLFGLGAPAALAVSMALSMSSTAVVLGILQQRKEVHLLHGRLCIGISIMQDLLSIAVLAALPVLAAWAGVGKAADADVDRTERVLALVSHAGLAIGGILLMLGFAHYLLPRLLREASRDGNTEGLLVASAGAGLGAAVLTTVLGFGPALGAFLAGFMLSSTPFRHQLAGQLSPMRDLFMAVFFTAVGVKLNIATAAQNWWIVLAAVVLTMGLKTIAVSVSVWAGGATAVIAGTTGFLLAQAGEFSLVILGEAEKSGLVSDKSQGIIIPLVVFSLILTEPAAGLARRLAPRLSRIPSAWWLSNPALRDRGSKHAAQEVNIEGWGTSDDPAAHARRHVIIAGFGVVGRNLAEHFAARQIPYTVIELNPDTVIRQQKLGRATVFGDATNPDVLHSAGVETAEAVVLTIPDDEATARACRLIRELRPDIFIGVRAGYLGRAITAHEAGADHVTIEEVVTAQDMAIKVMNALDKRYSAREQTTPHL